MAELSLRGAFTALVTPFTEDGSAIDWEAFEKLVTGQIEGGISGLVPCGTTGETPTLSAAEQVSLIERCAKLSGGRVPVLAGTGSNCTEKSIASSLAALEAGADAVMIVMPYYNKPTQAGLVRHVELIAKAVDAPIVLYNIPGRSSVDLSVESTLRILDSCPNVVGIKDATGNVVRCQEVLGAAGDRITVMSGDDPLSLPMMSVGARGVISVTGNLLPAEVAEVAGLALQEKWSEARPKHAALFPVHKAMFIEGNPGCVKAALASEGRMYSSVRPPVVEPSDEGKAAVFAALQAYRRGK